MSTAGAKIFSCFVLMRAGMPAVPPLRVKGKPLALSIRLKQNSPMSETEASGKARARCREIMTTDVKTVDRGTSICEVAALMRDADVGSLPVVENGKLAGIVTDRDIVVRALAEGRDPSTSVAEAMRFRISDFSRMILAWYSTFAAVVTFIVSSVR